MRKHRKMKQFLVMVTALLLTVIQGIAVHAAESGITVQTPCEGFPYRIYKVGEIQSDGKYILQGDFADSSVNMNIETADDAAQAALTLSGYADVQGIQPDISGQASEDGITDIDLEEDALYLLREESYKAGDTTYRSDARLFIPGQIEADTEGIRLLLVKHESFTDEKQVTYTIRKIWDDKEGSSRPGNVTVSILKNGQIDHTVTLSADNNWSYEFTVTDDGSIYNIQENNVSEGYVFRVEQRDTVFVITNTFEDAADFEEDPITTEDPSTTETPPTTETSPTTEVSPTTETPSTTQTPATTEEPPAQGKKPGKAPKTGDVSLRGPILLASLSGILLLVLGFAFIKVKRDED